MVMYTKARCASNCKLVRETQRDAANAGDQCIKTQTINDTSTSDSLCVDLALVILFNKCKLQSQKTHGFGRIRVVLQ